jgi:hypothetical protein
MRGGFFVRPLAKPRRVLVCVQLERRKILLSEATHEKHSNNSWVNV